VRPYLIYIAVQECVRDNVGHAWSLLHLKIEAEELARPLVLRDCGETMIQQVLQAEVISAD
jgi:hypothetical protein